MKSYSLPAFLALIILFFSGLNPARAQAQAEHILGTNDTIDIRVFQEPDLDAQVTVGQDGSVSLPLVGQVTVAGMTTTAASQAIARRYKEGYLVNPNVTVAIQEFAKKRFTILGSVNKPGVFFFPPGESLSLLQAIGLAGGYSKVADPSDILIKRSDAREPMKVNAKKMAKEGKAGLLMIRPGDVITVGESIW